MKIILIYSGGLDSTTLLYHLKSEKHSIKTISFDYGQRHSKEISCGIEICRSLSINNKVIDISAIKDIFGNNSQTSNIDVPHGHYADENMKKTVVPNRNMIMTSIAAAYAISEKYDAVCIGAHGGDHTIYPDCRKEFLTKLDESLKICDWHKISLIMPFVNKSKTDIVTIGSKIGVPFEKTWSCYKGLDYHCGECGTCIERKEAFKIANIKDNTKYLI